MIQAIANLLHRSQPCAPGWGSDASGASMDQMPVHPWSKVQKHPEGLFAPHLTRDRDPEAAQAACRFSAALLPFRLSLTMSKDNFWPSARLRIPARSTAEM